MAQQNKKSTRPVLFLIKGEELDSDLKAQAPTLEPPKSAIGVLMKAYADAIDREVQLLLEI